MQDVSALKRVTCLNEALKFTVAEIVVHLLLLPSSISDEGLRPTLSLAVGSAVSSECHVLLLDDSFPAAAWQVEAVSKSHPEGLQPILGGLC